MIKTQDREANRTPSISQFRKYSGESGFEVVNEEWYTAGDRNHVKYHKGTKNPNFKASKSKSKKTGDLRRIVRNFGTETTAHGLNRVVNSKSVLRQMVWVIAFLTALVAFVVQAIILSQQYKDRPVNVKLEFVSKTSLVFPAVTVCNTNKVRFSAIAKSGYHGYRELLDAIETNDVLPYYVPCFNGSFFCGDGLTCLSLALVCDGARQCLDGSDEDNCSYGSCSYKQFKCKAGSKRGFCIDQSLRCDGKPDCYDSEDEKNCGCSDQEFRCDDGGRSGVCIPLKQKCDGVEDCNGGADEEICTISNGFFCDGGSTRIPESFVCDGKADCDDVTDETRCVQPAKCPAGTFQCGNGNCLGNNVLCDWFNDCLDWTDESHCQGKMTACDVNETRCPDGACVTTLENCDWYFGDTGLPKEHVSSFPCPGNLLRCSDFSCTNNSLDCSQAHGGDAGNYSLMSSLFWKKPNTNLNSSRANTILNSSKANTNLDFSKTDEYTLATFNNISEETSCLEICLGYDSANCYSAILDEKFNTCTLLKTSLTRTDDAAFLTDDGSSSAHYYENKKANYPYNQFNQSRGYALGGFYDKWYENLSETKCLESCLEEKSFKCRSVDYFWSKRLCYLSSENTYSATVVSLVEAVGVACFQVKKEIFPMVHFNEVPGYRLNKTSPLWTHFAVDEAECLNFCLIEGRIDCRLVEFSSDGYCRMFSNTDGSLLDLAVQDIQFSYYEKALKYPLNMFTKKPATALGLHNDRVIYMVDIKTCLEACLWENSFVCRSLDYSERGMCWLSVDSQATVPDGLKRFTATNYFEPRKAVCLDGDFACERSPVCLKSQMVCDGHIDCPDGSDEHPSRCPDCGQDQFRCSYGGPSGLCISQIRRCDGHLDCYRGQDEQECTICNAFRCDEDRCLPITSKCDFVVNCQDESDEEDCEKRACVIGKEFRCSNLKCIDSTLVCNFRDDCGDSSDELPCHSEDDGCRRDQFRCVSGQCIDSNRSCDGQPDCGPSGEDELDCHQQSEAILFMGCADNSFECADGTCVNSYYRCNVRVDCPDGSDEVNCTDPEKSIGCFRGSGATYRGMANTTASGRACLPWRDSESKYTPDKLPDKGLEGNFCRNPVVDYEAGHEEAINYGPVDPTEPWCYYKADGDQQKYGGRWYDFCGVPHCETMEGIPRTNSLEDTWYHSFSHLDITPGYLEEFENSYYKNPGFERVKGEDPPDWYRFMTYSSVPDFSDLQEVFKLSKEQTTELGHQFDDFILQCQYDQQPCADGDFIAVQSDKYGNCYTFNHHKEFASVKNSTRAGALSGLKLTLFTEQMEYVSIFGQDSGVRVSIHDNGAEAFPAENGFTVRPGTVTSVALTEHVLTRLGQPWGNCDHSETVDENGYRATYESCVKRCLYRYMLAECECVDTFAASGPRCMVTNSTQEICRQLIYFLHQKNLLPCKCEKPCVQNWYEKTISQSYWPSLSYQDRLLRTLHSLNNKTKELVDTESAQANLVRLEVFFEELSRQEVTENKAYEIQNLIGDIGGTMGFYIGLSLLTVIEFMELAFNIFKYWLDKADRSEKL